MGIKRIFVSHAGPDAAIATTLAEHLRNAGHDAKIDTLDIPLGGNVIAFMNEELDAADAVIILFSTHTASATWQNPEIEAAVWNELAGDGGRCIVVRLDDAPIPPILRPRKYRRLEPEDRDSLLKLVEDVCAVLFSDQPASSLVAEAFRPDSPNPFRHLRAEFFEDKPALHARAFALPDPIKVGALEDMTPCFLDGSRGTGKSMLLLSLRARNFLARNSFEQDAPRRFGFYLKLTRGAICNAGIRVEADRQDPAAKAILTDIAEQELMLQLMESLFSELAYCARRDLIDCDRHGERSLCESAANLLFASADAMAVSFEDLQDAFSNLHKQLADFIRRRFIYQEASSVPTTAFGWEQFKHVLRLVRRAVPALESSMFVVLLDEYENLLPYQKRIVNGLVKFGPPHFSIKIARKFASGDTPGTTTEQDVQEIHDYTRVPLVYNLEDRAENKAYRELLQHIVEKMVKLDGDRPFDVNELLPGFGDSEVEPALCLAEVAQLCKRTPEGFENLPAEKRREKKTYYGQAAIYRVLVRKPGPHREKRFGGFNQLAFLGSGIIRYFQEFLSVGYHLTYGTGSVPRGALVIPAEQQSKAVHVVSQHNLTTLSRNVERYGEELKYFLLDLGGCLRHKLLKHTSEPEAARLTIEDPQMLEDESMAALRGILAVGEREGVFQTKEGLPAFKPKHGSDPQPTEFNICRVYAPVLQISPRLRWRTFVKCADLQGLLEPGERNAAVRRLKKMVENSERGTHQDFPLLQLGEER